MKGVSKIINRAQRRKDNFKPCLVGNNFKKLLAPNPANIERDGINNIK
jgi:hypothetical protein